jgi:uncharacterized protein
MPGIVSACSGAAAPERRVAVADAEQGGERGSLRTWRAMAPRRLSRLASTTVLGRRVRVAGGLRARLLGLSHLDREQAGEGLLIPRCSSVHTFGMRFPLDLVFLDDRGAVLSVRRGVSPRRVVSSRGASAVLELPSEPRGATGPWPQAG